MVDNVPDWASQTPANVPQATDTSAPSWASAQGGAPAWATRTPVQQGGQITEPDDVGNNPVERLGHAMHGAFMGAVMNGFGGLVARKGFEMAGTGIDQLKSAYPGMPDEWYTQKQHDIINQTVVEQRQKYSNEVSQNSQGFNPLAFGASVVGGADPTWLINPGAPVEGAVAKMGLTGVAGAAARVAGNAGVHAAMGSASDAAYQGADILDHIQKDFDVKRNLEASVAQGVFGGVLSGGHEVAPYITELFKTRGVDTTPADRPAGVTTPLSGQGLSPEETAQYHQVLQTGDEHAIRGFFDGRNTTPPSFADAHEWVQRRDAVSQGIAPDDYADPMFHPQPDWADQRSSVQEHISNETANWKNAPDFEVINHTDDIQDPAIRQQAISQGADHPDALGFLGDDGKVRIFANKIDSPDTLNAVLYHEALGHYGLAQQFGTKLDSTLKVLMDRNVGQFGKDVDAWQKENPGAYNGDRVRAAEEVLANMSNKGVIKPSVSDALTAHVRDFGRKMGLKLGYSDNEIRTILAMAHDAVINGKGRDVVGNGFKYVFTGPNAADFSHENPTAFKANDGVVRNEVNDSRSHVTLPEVGKSAPLGDVLSHPLLHDQYPQLKDVTVKHEDIGPDVHGQYDPETKTITVSPHDPDPHSTVLHETQHAIQDIEQYPGFHDTNAKNDTMSDEEYNSNPLEKEAFATEDRKNMSYAERTAEVPKFMRRSDIAPKDVAEEAYERLGQGYVPKYRSWEEAKSAAADSALDPAKIMASRSVGNLDKKLFIYDAAAKEANATLTALADHADKVGGLTDAEHVLGMETAAHFSYVLGRIENDASQIARGLNAMKAISFSRNNLLALKDALEKDGTNMEALTDPDTMLKFLKQYNALAGKNNPKGAAFLARGVTQPYWWQYLLTWRNNMMLSGLSTHLKSTMDMATTAGRDLEEKFVALGAAPLRALASSLGVKNVQPGLHPTEVAMDLWGATRAALDAQTYKDAAHALMTGGPQRFANPNGVPNPRIPIASKVTDAIAAQDSFFRSVLINKNLYALGTRKALQDAKTNGTSTKWDDLTTIGANHARTPTPAMLKEATDLAENTMLLNKSPVNSGIDNLKRIRPGMNGMQQLGSFVINYLTPFIRVQSNALMNQIVRRSPLSFLDPVTRADFAAGGVRRDVAISRTLIGSFILANAWIAADPAKKKLTSEGPDNLAKVKEMEASGWSQNSVHENGRYNKNSNLNISLNPFDLHNNTASLVAGVREAWEEGKSAKDLVTGLKLASAAVMHDLVSQTFVNDLGEAYDAFSGKGQTLLQKSGKFLGNEAKSMMPNATTQAARILDPNQHDTSGGVGAQIQSTIPGATEGLPIRYNVYGQPMKTGTSVTGIHTWLSSGNGQNETTDPTEKELSRLADLTKSAIVTATPKTIKVEGVSLKLTPSQVEDYQKYAGQTTVQAVRDQMTSGTWNKMSDQDRVNEIRAVQTQAKSEVRDALLQKEGWLQPDQLDSLRTQLNAK